MLIQRTVPDSLTHRTLTRVRASVAAERASAVVAAFLKGVVIDVGIHVTADVWSLVAGVVAASTVAAAFDQSEISAFALSYGRTGKGSSKGEESGDLHVDVWLRIVYGSVGVERWNKF